MLVYLGTHKTELKTQLLDDIDWPEHVHGGIRGHSNISNAKSHLGKRYHFLTDIRRFFPSINNKRVYLCFLSLGLSPDAASLATKLTTIDGSLPQGTPTSPHLANLAFLNTDEKIMSLLNQCSVIVIYTRFFDDLVFSSATDFQHLTPKIVDIIRQDGYRLKYRKRSDSLTIPVTYYKIGPVEITGIDTRHNVTRAPTRKHNKLARLEEGTPQHTSLGNYIERIESD